MNNQQKLQDIIGKSIASVKGLDEGSTEVKIKFTDGSVMVFCHYQDCCEYVRLHDFELTVLDESKLVGGVVNDAREDTNDAGDYPDLFNFSGMWTFYNINTSRGCISMRWLGESNGYYSEAVDIEYQPSPAKADD